MTQGQNFIAGYNAKLDSQEVIGEMVYWSVHETRSPITQVESKMEKYGFDKKILDRSTEKNNFIDAVFTVSKRYGSDMHKILDDASHIVFKIVNAVPDKVAQEMKFDQHTTVSFNKDAKIVAGQGKEEIISEVRDTFRQYLDSVSDKNYRATIKTILDTQCSSISLRPSGGFYFVVKSLLEKVENLDKLTNELGFGTIFRIRLPDSVSEKKVVLVTAQEDCEGRLDIIDREVNAITSRISSLENASERAKQVKELYDMLCENFDMEVKAENMLNKYKALEEKITQKIEEFSEKKAKA